MSLWEYINHKSEDCSYDLWWNIEADYFISECHKHDGGKEEIKQKLLKIGYDL